MPDSIEHRLYRVAGDLFAVPPQALSHSSSPNDIELWDSIGHLNLVLALEQEFGVRFSPEQVDGLIDLGQAARMLADMETKHGVTEGSS